MPETKDTQQGGNKPPTKFTIKATATGEERELTENELEKLAGGGIVDWWQSTRPSPRRGIGDLMPQCCGSSSA
jgi:hypothetical protein